MKHINNNHKSQIQNSTNIKIEKVTETSAHNLKF